MWLKSSGQHLNCLSTKRNETVHDSCRGTAGCCLGSVSTSLQANKRAMNRAPYGPGPPPFHGPPYPGPYGPPPPGYSSFPRAPMVLGPPLGLHGGPRGPPHLLPPPGLIAGMKRPGPGPEPLPRRDAPPPAAAGPVEKSTMVSVGKIAPSVDNAVMHTLLGACGAVKSWKRAEDPETKVLKGFGFCEFQEAEGVLRAIRLLNGFKVDGQELVIKGNSATQRYVEQYEADKLARRAKEAAARVEAAKKKQEEGEVLDDKTVEAEAAGLGKEDEEKDNQALEIIMGVVSDREEAAAAKAAGASSAAADFLKRAERGDLPLPPPPPVSGGSSKGRDRDLDRDRDGGSRDVERDVERDRARAIEKEYDSRLRDWERHEKQRQEMRELERTRTEAAEKARLRACRADLEGSDSESDVPPWARKPYRGSRLALERRRVRMHEEEADALDRQREQREADRLAAERKRRREEDPLEGVGEEHEGGATTSEGVVIKSIKGEPGYEVKAEPSEASAGPGPGHSGARATSRRHQQAEEEGSQVMAQADQDLDDPIYKAMVAAAVAGSGGRTPTAAVHPNQRGGTQLPSPSYRTSATDSPGPQPAGQGTGRQAARLPDGWSVAPPPRPLLAHTRLDPHASLKSEHRGALRSESPPPASAANTPSGEAGWRPH
ncbi:uncharacterized protein HaLaN_09124 [Haematococcus lacustris]|uniref:RRM domain-containing protein n=1 Tax=Haematococcus lacustris TaxID=44745 RepID=A0A699Z2Q7_HAELA|nr:uncharacterized protein HaLaN_09124 [Haematococcus lacustris]